MRHAYEGSKPAVTTVASSKEEAMKKVPPSVSKQQAELYKKMESEYLKSAKAALPMDNSYLG